MDEYYLQDKRSFVGNAMLWWAKDHKGYTTKLALAHVFTKDEAYRQHASRETDVPWPKAYIDSRAELMVDFQRTDKAQTPNDSFRATSAEGAKVAPGSASCAGGSDD